MVQSKLKSRDDRIHVFRDFKRPKSDLVDAFRNLSSATGYEASGKKGAFNQDIKPISQGMKVCGPALTVLCMGADNLMIHKALDIAQTGDILVISVAGESNVGFWGDVLTTAAQARKIGGLVINGCVRDRDEIVELGFPVFSRGLSIRGTTKHGLGLINHPMACAGALVWPGDLILGDSDGIVCVPRDRLTGVLQKSQIRDQEESEEKTTLSKGIESTFTLYGFDKITKSLGLLER